MLPSVASLLMLHTLVKRSLVIEAACICGTIPRLQGMACRPGIPSFCMAVRPSGLLVADARHAANETHVVQHNLACMCPLGKQQKKHAAARIMHEVHYMHLMQI